MPRIHRRGLAPRTPRPSYREAPPSGARENARFPRVSRHGRDRSWCWPRP